MLEALLDAVIDCAKMLPILYLAYLLMEFFEHKAGEKTNNLITKVGRAGPIVGSLLGIIPQCGFSGAVAGIRAVGHTVMGGVGEKPRQQLIDDRFLVVHCLSVVDNSVAAVPGRLKPLASRKFMVSR